MAKARGAVTFSIDPSTVIGQDGVIRIVRGTTIFTMEDRPFHVLGDGQVSREYPQTIMSVESAWDGADMNIAANCRFYIRSGSVLADLSEEGLLRIENGMAFSGGADHPRVIAQTVGDARIIRVLDEAAPIGDIRHLDRVHYQLTDGRSLMLTTQRDVPALRTWLLTDPAAYSNAAAVVLDLPDAGRVEVRPADLRRLRAAVEQTISRENSFDVARAVAADLAAIEAQDRPADQPNLREAWRD